MSTRLSAFAQLMGRWPSSLILCRQVPLSGNPIAGIYRECVQFSHNHLHLWKEARGKRNPQK